MSGDAQVWLQPVTLYVDSDLNVSTSREKIAKAPVIWFATRAEEALEHVCSAGQKTLPKRFSLQVGPSQESLGGGAYRLDQLSEGEPPFYTLFDPDGDPVDLEESLWLCREGVFTLLGRVPAQMYVKFLEDLT